MIYIDDCKIKYKRMIMSHMAADTLKELHEMADHLGLSKHFQNKKGKPHYDICKSKKELAIRMGAIELPRRDFIRRLNGLPCKHDWKFVGTVGDAHCSKCRTWQGIDEN